MKPKRDADQYVDLHVDTTKLDDALERAQLGLFRMQPLHLLVCSNDGCTNDMYALLTFDDMNGGGHEPMRLCRECLAGARIGLRLAADLAATKREERSFALLSPIEQYQLEGR